MLFYGREKFCVLITVTVLILTETFVNIFISLLIEVLTTFFLSLLPSFCVCSFIMGIEQNKTSAAAAAAVSLLLRRKHSHQLLLGGYFLTQQHLKAFPSDCEEKGLPVTKRVTFENNPKVLAFCHTL